MNLPPPTDKQARLFWAALTGLAAALIIALIVGAVWGLGQVLNKLSPVVWPLAVAGVLAYLLDPVVDFFERRRVPRPRAILLVFLIGLFIVLAVFGSVVPQVVVQTSQLSRQLPEFAAKTEKRVEYWATHPPGWLRRLSPGEAAPAPIAVADTNSPATEVSVAITNTLTITNTLAATAPTGNTASLLKQWLGGGQVAGIADWLKSVAPKVGTWMFGQVTKAAGLFGVIAGLALIPIYLFYLLLEKRAITDNWTTYLPVRDSNFKEELVFVLRSINDYLIAFFRGQVLVALCDGVLYGIGFALIGLPYAFLIGVLAMVLTIIPFLGAIVTCGAALLIALVSFGDWQHPLLVLGVFAVVQGIEGYVLQPKIIGDRVGLHPMVIIIAIMTGTTLLGGILGGLLAIPLAAVLRVVLARYVWRKVEPSPVVLEVK
jgi:predicted PurR-regulated permease PerM